MKSDAPRTTVRPARRWLKIAIGGVVVLAIIAAIVYARSGGSPGGFGRGRANQKELPVPVLATTAQRADIPVYLEAVGTIRALNTVTVRSQVDGKLIEVVFKEGQDVKKGDVLARIDPVTFQAQLDQAVAKKAQDEAQLANARIDLDRYERLAATNSINRQQADTQRALVAQLEAQVKSDSAAIDNARAIVGYTTIVAPLDGRTGIRQVDEGNVVHASDTNGIVVITQVKPISAVFSLPQQHLDRVNAAFARQALPADAVRSDNDAVIARGRLLVVDNQVDQSTGTVKLKAEFPNADLQLWPGQFINVRLLVDTMTQVIVVPTGAVQRGPRGTYVFVVKDGSSVALRPVTVSLQNETQSVIASGLDVGETVVTTGFVNLADGSKISVSTPAGSSGGSDTGQPPQRRERRGPPGGGQQAPPAAGAPGSAPGGAPR